MYVFNNEFDPILLPGETAQLIGENKIINIECVRHGALPEIKENLGALTAATWATDIEFSELEMEDNVMAQYRMRVVRDINLKFNNLGPTKQWKTRTGEFYLPQFPVDEDSDSFLKTFLFKASEFFVFEQDTPRFSAYSVVAQASSYVLFSGWRFKVKPFAGKGRIPIYISGW